MSMKKADTDRWGLPLVTVHLRQQTQSRKRSVAQMPRGHRTLRWRTSLARLL
jgi:hypothetical protein